MDIVIVMDMDIVIVIVIVVAILNSICSLFCKKLFDY